MLAVVKDKASPGVSIKDIPIPKPQKDEVLVKIKYASICGTDIGIYDWIPWAQNHIKPPTVLGHEMVGEVIQINSDQKTNIKLGDLVSSETHIFCLNCYQCQIKNYHVCENLDLFGIGRDGSFSEFATIPIRTTWVNDPAVDPEIMCIQEPIGNAVHVVTKAEVKDKKVLVMGLGPTGLCAGVVAKACGADLVVGVNDTQYRRELAQSLGGFDRVEAKPSFKDKDFYDVVLEMSGNNLGIQLAFESVRIAGKIIAFGIPKGEISIDWGKYLINKEVTIESVFGRQVWDSWHKTTDLLVSGKVNLKSLITHRFKLAEFKKAMEVAKSRICGKVLLIP